jgi:Flp pilus assembly protein TadD
MSVGLGIFLSTLIVSIIYLFQKSSDKTKKILKVLSLLIIVLPIILGLVVYCYYEYVDYIDKKPKKFTEYLDIKLGSSIEEVRFVKGFPNNKFSFYKSSLNSVDIGDAKIESKYGDNKTVNLWELGSMVNSKNYKISTKYSVSDLLWKKDKYKATFDVWEYGKKYGNEYLDFSNFIRFNKDDKVSSISCYAPTSLSCCKISSLYIGMKWDRVIEIFGSPVYGYIDFSDGKRFVCYPEYNLCLTLKESSVVFINVKLWEAEDYYYFAKMMVDNINGKNFEGFEAMNTPVQKQQVQKTQNVRQVSEEEFDRLEKIYGNYYDKEYKQNASFTDNAKSFATGSYKAATESLQTDYKIKAVEENTTPIYTAAIKALDNAIKLDSGYAKAYIKKGDILYQLKKYNEAVKSYNQAINLGYKSAFLHNKLGLALGKLGKNKEEMEAYDLSISLNPKYEIAYANKSYLLYEEGKYEEAINYIDKAIEINKKNYTDENKKYSLFHLGFLLEQKSSCLGKMKK